MDLNHTEIIKETDKFLEIYQTTATNLGTGSYQYDEELRKNAFLEAAERQADLFLLIRKWDREITRAEEERKTMECWRREALDRLPEVTAMQKQFVKRGVVENQE
jgi:hypothetical protein